MSEPDHQGNLIKWALASGISVQQIHPKSLLKYLIDSPDRLTRKKLIGKRGRLSVRSHRLGIKCQVYSDKVYVNLCFDFLI